MNSQGIKAASLVSATLMLCGCAALQSGASATAQLVATTGNAVTGSVSFTQKGAVVAVSGTVVGLAPNREHGFHIHDKGDCSSGDGMSTGGHFNPEGKPHAAHSQDQHHAGDLPSLKADAAGNARIGFESTTLRVGQGATDVVGRGLIVHRDPDDFTTQPTGTSGPRLACAVILRN